MKSLSVSAKTKELNSVLNFIKSELKEFDCPAKAQMQICVAAEEIFINIANYAYNPSFGDATVRCDVCENPLSVTIQFLDGGKPYNPLLKDDPDISLDINDREIGGLGIFMVKKSMDSINYEYKDGKNILTIQKNC